MISTKMKALKSERICFEIFKITPKTRTRTAPTKIYGATDVKTSINSAL